MIEESEANKYEERRDNALKYCREQINSFESRKIRDRRWYRLAQATVIFLSALTPLLILGEPGFQIPKLVQAIPAAIAAVVTGINSLFDWQGNWTRYSVTETALRAEKLAFEARATEAYSANLDAERERSLSNFVSNINSILEREVSEWSARALKSQQPPEENRGEK
jgi:hypothetical protein